jgi:hypothetical protein
MTTDAPTYPAEKIVNQIMMGTSPKLRNFSAAVPNPPPG